ncbi:hypothetical protein ACIOVF_06570 [Pseudomonas sp. NPDC087612]|uniref:hypothetical protein n=1 Tax=Pseudomonas sp. NPDC087612 TaxID=3364441 RepID=UPI0037F3E257
MRNLSATKWLVGILTVIAVLQFTWIFMSGAPQPHLSAVVNTLPVGTHSAVYEVLSDCGGATVGHTYLYYVAERQPDDKAVLNNLQDQTPFLVSRQSGAIVAVDGRRIRARTQTTVYRFSSIAILRENDQAIPLIIELTATSPED